MGTRPAQHRWSTPAPSSPRSAASDRSRRRIPAPAAAPASGRSRRPSPLAAALASALLPGAGQILTGRRARGALLLAMALPAATAAGLAAGIVLGGGAFELLAQLLRPGVLTGIIVGNAVLAAIRLAGVLDAWRAARRRGARSGAVQVLGLTIAIALLVAAPHAAIAFAGAEAQRVIEAVFVAPSPASPSAPPAGTVAPAPAGQPTTKPTAASDAEPAATPAAEPVPAPSTAPDPDPAEDRLLGGAERLTVLLLGSDAGHDRSGTRIDAMVVASIDVGSGRAVLISLARNLGDVPLSGVFAERLGERFSDRLMGLHRAASIDPVLAAEYADPGIAAHVNAAETLLALEIDHVAQVDMAGFVDVIDALGGVEVDVGDPIRVRLSAPRAGEERRTYDIPAGRQRLDGHTALAYVRSRTGTDDYDRMRRQRCLLGSLAAQADAMRLLRGLPQLTDLLAERVRTDMPADRLPDVVRLAGRLDISTLRTLGITPPGYTLGLNPAGFHAVDVEKIRAAAHGLIMGEAPPGDAADLGATCG